MQHQDSPQTLISTEVPTDAEDTMESWEDSLELYRVELTAVLKPDRYFDIFRREAVLDERDCEEIGSEALRPARAQKAGHFLDTIKMRGQPAFNLLRDCLEADHPDLYRKMTGKDPRPKPPVSLPSRCSCDCHDHNDRISLDLIEAYKDVKHNNVSLQQDKGKLQKSLDKALQLQLKSEHKAQTIRKKYDTWEAEREELTKLRSVNVWQREQLYGVQAKTLDYTNQLLVAHDNLRKSNLENHTLINRVRELEARLAFQRKKSVRLEKENCESAEKMKKGDMLMSLVAQLQIELQKEKIKVAQDTVDLHASSSSTSSELHNQTKMDILIADKEEAIAKCEEVVRELNDVRTQLFDAQENKGKTQARNENLEARVTLLDEELDMVIERLQMAQEELEQVSKERSQLMEERSKSIEETALSMLERDSLVKKLNQERTSYLKKSQELYKYKKKMLQRQKETQSDEGRPSSLVSTDSSGDGGSKRGSARSNKSGISVESSQWPTISAINGNDSASATSAPTTTSRSISLADIKHSRNVVGTEDDDEDFDYEYPIARERTTAMTSGRRMTGTKAEPALGVATNSVTEEAACVDVTDLPNDAHLWAEFGTIPGSSNDIIGPVHRRIMRNISKGQDSLEVEPGSRKDKYRTPGPRISSCDYGTDYMRELRLINRRSKTVGCNPDDDIEFNPEDNKDMKDSEGEDDDGTRF